MEGIFLLCLWGGAEHKLKNLGGGAAQLPLWRKPGSELPWRNQEQGETESLTKRKAHF
jgi:hypothetical protein